MTADILPLSPKTPELQVMLSGAAAVPGRVTLPVTEPEAHPASPAVASVRITNAYPRLPGAIRRLPGCRTTRIVGQHLESMGA